MVAIAGDVVDGLGAAAVHGTGNRCIRQCWGWGWLLRASTLVVGVAVVTELSTLVAVVPAVVNAGAWGGCHGRRRWWWW